MALTFADHKLTDAGRGLPQPGSDAQSDRALLTEGGFGPAVLAGLYWCAGADDGWVDNPRVRAMTAEALLQGVRLAVFTAQDVDLTAGLVRYRSLGAEGWHRWHGPLPDVAMIGGGPRTDTDTSCLRELRAVVPVATGLLPSKGTICEALKQSAVATHLIPSETVDSADPEAGIHAFLARHPRAVLKPTAGGRRGRDVIFLARDGNDIVSRELNRQWRLPAGEAIAPLASRLARTGWMLQKFIVSRARDGRAFDIRVHIHKDDAGQWRVVRAYVRLSEAGLLVSNTSRGGYQGDLEPFLAGLGERGAELAQRVRGLGIEAGAAVETAFGCRLDELGVDILIDGSLHPWIVEINARPQSRFHEFERARYALGYARHVAALWRTGSWTAGDAFGEL